MKIFNKLSLRSKIIGMVIFVCTLNVVGGAVAVFKFGDSYENSTVQRIKGQAIGLSEKIAAQFFERYGDVQAFAINPVLKDMNVARLPNYLDQYVTLYGIYDVILVVDKDGKFVSANTRDTAGNLVKTESLKNEDFSKHPWFQAAMKEQWTADKEKGFNGTFFEDLHEDPIYSLAFDQKKTGVSFSTTIKNDSGEVVGVLTNRTNNKWIEVELVDLVKGFMKRGFTKVQASVVNKDGLIISNLAPNLNDGELVFDKEVLKENLINAIEGMKTEHDQHEASGFIGFDKLDQDEDLVGFKKITEPKFPSSIGWTTVVRSKADDSFSAVWDAKVEFALLSGAFSLLSIIFGFWFGMTTSKSVGSVTDSLSANSDQLTDAAGKIAAQSTQLSEAATEQAAALQETVAAVDEISAMVGKNAEAAEQSKVVSAKSREAATEGRQTVESMIQAIDDINSANEEISEQMSHSNRQLSEITKLIQTIGAKTKVINEIVFQTKLLSFNASVEAARAGEYGKGFAVVAEEVGNLAQMSGNAAKEITELLDQSVGQVEAIVSETKQKVEKLMLNSKSKVEVGSQTAKQCNEALEEILKNVSSVDSLVAEIAVASQEQGAGIREISKAVGQMEEVTQQNSAAAQAASAAAEQLNAQSQELNGIVNTLVNVVDGLGKKPVLHEEKPKGSVIKFRKNETTKVASHTPEPETFKKVSGGDFVTPSADDPGFRE